MKISAICVRYCMYIYNTASYRHVKLWKTLSTFRISLAFAKTREEAARFVPRERKSRRRAF